MYSDKISDEEKEAFNRYLNGDKKTILKRTLDLPASIQSIILPTTKYNGKSINTIDKINLIDFISKLQSQKFLDIDLNENNEEIVFESFKIGKTTISASDQAKFIKLMSNMDNKSSYEEMYKKIDEAPLSIQTVIRPTMNMKNIKRIAMFLASLYILSALFTYFEQLIMAVVSNNFAKDLRNKITNKINRLPLKYFDKNQTGDILSRVTNDIDTVAQSMNQSLASLFIELQKYYQDFLFNLENSTYNTLKFLSNPNCQLLEINSLESQKLLNNLYWHPQIQTLTIPTSFVASLKIVMDAKNWECLLKTLTLVQDIAVSSPNFEESIVSLFSGINSISIQNIHFINVPYNKKILNALFKHIELFYSMTNESLNFILGSKPDSKIILSNSSEKDFNSFEEPDHPKTKIFLHIQEEKLPIINLSWKKTPNSKLTSVNFEEAIDLRGIYYMLMDMLIKAYKFNNHKLPEVFNKLDLSETVVSDDIGFLVKIITQFKIIKELDISNTKIYSSGKVINSDKFLRKIKLTNDFMKVFNFDEENAFIENTLKEIESFKNDTEEEKNPPPTSLKDEDTSYTFFMGIFPILEKLYAYNTDIKENIARDIYVLFKKLKFFEGFYCSSSSNNNILKNTINTLANIIQNDSSSFCENVFKINNCS